MLHLEEHGLHLEEHEEFFGILEKVNCPLS